MSPQLTNLKVTQTYLGSHVSQINFQQKNDE